MVLGIIAGAYISEILPGIFSRMSASRLEFMTSGVSSSLSSPFQLFGGKNYDKIMKCP